MGTSHCNFILLSGALTTMALVVIIVVGFSTQLIFGWPCFCCCLLFAVCCCCCGIMAEAASVGHVGHVGHVFVLSPVCPRCLFHFSLIFCSFCVFARHRWQCRSIAVAILRLHARPQSNTHATHTHMRYIDVAILMAMFHAPLSAKFNARRKYATSPPLSSPSHDQPTKQPTNPPLPLDCIHERLFTGRFWSWLHCAAHRMADNKRDFSFGHLIKCSTAAT